MKTNVPIELTDEERDRLATHLDGKETKRLATRKEVVELATRLVQEFIEHGDLRPPVPQPDPVRANRGRQAGPQPSEDSVTSPDGVAEEPNDQGADQELRESPEEDATYLRSATGRECRDVHRKIIAHCDNFPDNVGLGYVKSLILATGVK